jgi:hypothetical protein
MSANTGGAIFLELDGRLE